jgi:ElaB/YqjD/DUF883 family membrane-anchored ribosome-binding protein
MTTELTSLQPKADDLQHQIDDTRAHLMNNVEALEHEVVGLVQGATAAVTGTIGSIQEAVGDTVGTVQDAVRDTMTSVRGGVTSLKQAFDIRGHVRGHPWLMLGGAVALGYLCGRLLRGRR